MVASPTTAETKSEAVGLLIFDGDCGFCTNAARKFGLLVDAAVTIEPWQALDLADYGLTEQEVSTAAYWVQDGHNYRGADAVAHGLRVCGQPWATFGRLLGVPPFIWLARALYPVIAKYRYRLPGSSDACRL